MGEVRFVPNQPMAKVGGCQFCNDRYPGSTVHIFERVGEDGELGGLRVRMCDSCVASLSRHRNEWSVAFKKTAASRGKEKA